VTLERLKKRTVSS